jgi:PncC family amidohydrolase
MGLFNEACFTSIMDSISEKLPELAKKVLDVLGQKDLTLAIAESATGGYASHLLTNIPGCSKRFIGGIVAYTAQAKNMMLGVDWDLINDYGTVSPEVCEALLTGLKNAGADVGLAITGVAGSKLEGKPTGKFYIGVGTQTCNFIHEFQFEGTRLEIKNQAVEKAYSLLIEELEKA